MKTSAEYVYVIKLAVITGLIFAFGTSLVVLATWAMGYDLGAWEFPQLLIGGVAGTVFGWIAPDLAERILGRKGR